MGFTGYGLRQKLSSPSASHIFDPSPRGFGVQSAALRACETTDAPYGLPRGFYHSFSRSHAALRAERSTVCRHEPSPTPSPFTLDVV